MKQVKYHCDICGSEIPTDSKLMISVKDNGGGNSLIVQDICFQCSEDLYFFIKSKQVKSKSISIPTQNR